MLEVQLPEQRPEEWCLVPQVTLSPWVIRSRRKEAKRPGRVSSVSSLFDDMDPELSPLMKNLERKLRTGETVTEEDFLEPFPTFRRKMEREFDEITEQFKRLSIENPDEELSANETNFLVVNATEDNFQELVDFPENNKHIMFKCNNSFCWRNDFIHFLASQLAPLLIENFMNVLTDIIW